MDWSYWTPSPEHKLVFKPVSEGLYEIIALASMLRSCTLDIHPDTVIVSPTLKGLYQNAMRRKANGTRTRPMTL